MDLISASSAREQDGVQGIQSWMIGRGGKNNDFSSPGSILCQVANTKLTWAKRGRKSLRGAIGGDWFIRASWSRT